MKWVICNYYVYLNRVETGISKRFGFNLNKIRMLDIGLG